jgi:prenyltransferase beta subunit
MRRAVVAAIVLGWLTLSLGQQKPVDTESALKPQIDRAVARAVQFLRQTQAANGSWDQMPGGQGQSGHTVGCTALAALALMEAGVPVRDPAVERPPLLSFSAALFRTSLCTVALMMCRLQCGL